MVCVKCNEGYLKNVKGDEFDHCVKYEYSKVECDTCTKGFIPKKEKDEFI
ncbi:hypothetical protein A3Q56_08504, partial [Intoshia linei]